MKLSVNADPAITKLGTDKALEAIAEAGFDCYDFPFFNTESEFFGDDYKNSILSVRKKADSLGLECNQAHAPFPSGRVGEDEFNAKRFDEIVRSIECASALGAEIIVVHPFHGTALGDSDEYEVNKGFYDRLIPYAEKFNIRIATENMFNYNAEKNIHLPDVCNSPQRFVKMVDYLDSPRITACLDTGHCPLVGEDASEIALALGHDRLKALHIHDNSGLGDEHMIPYMGNLNWDKICKALADVDYDGVFTFEANLVKSHLPVGLVGATLKYMNEIGRFLIEKIENFKN